LLTNEPLFVRFIPRCRSVARELASADLSKISAGYTDMSAATAAGKTPAAKSRATKTVARKTVAKKTGAKKAAATKAVVKKAVAKKVAVKKAGCVETPVEAPVPTSRRVRLIPQVELDGSADWTEFQKHEFLRYLEVTANVSASARLIGKKAAAADRLRKKDSKFADAWNEAASAALDKLEAVSLHRATNGVTRGKYYEGQKIGKEKYFSDQLAMFLLKARRPEVYGKVESDPQNHPDDKLSVPELITKKIAELRLKQQKKIDDAA
jgi:hypothetical protein